MFAITIKGQLLTEAQLEAVKPVLTEYMFKPDYNIAEFEDACLKAMEEANCAFGTISILKEE